MKQYKLYLLDFDGTAFDTLESLVAVYNEGFGRIGRTCTIDDVRVYMHHSIEEAVAIAKIKPEEINPFVEGILEAIEKELLIETIKAFPDFDEFMKISAERGYLLGIVSNNGDTHIQRVFKQNGINPSIFKCIIGHSPERRTKPHPDMIEYALDLCGIAKEETCYIGDSLQDVEAAEAAHIDGYLLDRDNDFPDFGKQRITSLTALFGVEGK